MNDNGNISCALLIITRESGSLKLSTQRLRFYTEALAASDPDLIQETFPSVKKYVFHFSRATPEMLSLP